MHGVFRGGDRAYAGLLASGSGGAFAGGRHGVQHTASRREGNGEYLQIRAADVFADSNRQSAVQSPRRNYAFYAVRSMDNA